MNDYVEEIKKDKSIIFWYIPHYYKQKDFSEEEFNYVYKNMMSRLHSIEKMNGALPSPQQLKWEELQEIRRIISYFHEFEKNIGRNKITSLFDASYGNVNEEMMRRINTMSEKYAIDKVNELTTIYDNYAYTRYTLLHKTFLKLQELIDLMWFFTLKVDNSWAYIEKIRNIIEDLTTDSVYKGEYYQERDLMFDVLLKNTPESNIDVQLSKEWDKCYKGKESPYFYKASALRYSKQYEKELYCLSKIEERYPSKMTYEMRDRLLHLSTIKNFDEYRKMIDQQEDYGIRLVFDVTPLKWNDTNFNGYFDYHKVTGIAIKNSLAIHEVNEGIQITSILPSLDDIASRLHEMLNEEYGDVVKVVHKQASTLVHGGEEKIDGILIMCEECPHLSLYLYLLKLGKKLNIQIYTLFVPVDKDPMVLKQTALAMHNHLSPSINVWENSLRDSVMANLQVILNSSPKQIKKDDTYIEF